MPGLDVRWTTLDESEAPVLENLYEFLLYDLARYFGFDAQPDGSYGRADRIDRYWTGDFTVHVPWLGEAPAGFAIIGRADRVIEDRAGRDIAEFFVVRKVRRRGLGRLMARHVWSMYPGDWLVRVAVVNEPAVPFWRSAIAEYTENAFEEEPAQRFDLDWVYFKFNNG